MENCFSSIAPLTYNIYSKNKVFESAKMNQKAPTIRIKIDSNLSEINFEGMDLSRTIIPIKNSAVYSGKKILKFNCKSAAFIFDKWKKKGIDRPVLLASVSSATGLLTFEKGKYFGKIMVLATPGKDSCDVINETDLEVYLGSVVSKEMNQSWPIEALKAQAVAARTYAYQKLQTQQVSRELGREAYFDIESSEKHQVGGDFFEGNKETKRATFSTRGEILALKNGKITPTFFHAKCGGHTLLPETVWESKVSGYESVVCPFCNGHGKGAWVNVISKKELRGFLLWLKKKGHIQKMDDDKINYSSIRIIAEENIKKFITLYLGIDSIKIQRPLLRRYFGRGLAQSNNFKIIEDENGFKLIGEGLGHGVGMCQLGALDMAQSGRSYKEILKHYFPNHELVRVY